MRTSRWAGLALLLAACTPEVCEVENLPFRGEPQTPEQLFQLVQYAAKNECCGSMYGSLSERTKAEHSETKFCLFWESLDLPEPYEEYSVAEVVRGGEFLGVLPVVAEPGKPQYMFVHYEEPGQVALDAQILLVFETDEQGNNVPRVGLQEQVDQNLPFAQPPAK